MANITYNIDDYAKALANLFADTEEIVKKAVYAGADVVADAIRANLNGIPVQEGEDGNPPYARPGEKLHGISSRQKSDLINAFGLAPMESKGDYINTKAGFDGYGSVKTKKYPRGVPNAMLMRSVESGTSFRDKHPTVRPAVTRTRKRAQQEMDDTINKEIEKRME